MLALVEKIESGHGLSPEAHKAMLDHLKNCDDKDKFSRFLPESVVVAHKTGSVSDARTDAGILYLKHGPVLLCVLTADNADHRWVRDNAGNLFCARVAQVVYKHYAASSTATSRSR